jgi:hypothetical protein
MLAPRWWKQQEHERQASKGGQECDRRLRPTSKQLDVSLMLACVLMSSDGQPAKRITGGASFPARIGTVTAIWPMAEAALGPDLISVHVRPGLLKRLLQRFVRPEARGDAAFWSAPWADLAPVEVGPRSVVLRVTGSRGCRFIVVGKHRLEPLLAELEARHVTTARVITTMHWYLGWLSSGSRKKERSDRDDDATARAVLD